MARRNTDKESLKGLREHDFRNLLFEVFDEEYATEILQSYKSAEFIKNKDGVYVGKIKTDVHTFYIAFQKTNEGFDILRFDFR